MKWYKINIIYNDVLIDGIRKTYKTKSEINKIKLTKVYKTRYHNRTTHIKTEMQNTYQRPHVTLTQETKSKHICKYTKYQ